MVLTQGTTVLTGAYTLLQSIFCTHACCRLHSRDYAVYMHSGCGVPRESWWCSHTAPWRPCTLVVVLVHPWPGMRYCTLHSGTRNPVFQRAELQGPCLVSVSSSGLQMWGSFFLIAKSFQGTPVLRIPHPIFQAG